MAQQQQEQHGEGDAAVRAANAPMQTNPGRRDVGIFIAILTSLAVVGLITQLRLGSGIGDDVSGQLVVRPDGGLVEIGRNSVRHTTQCLWMMIFTMLQLLALLAVCTAAVTMASGVFAATGTPQTVAGTKADKKNEEAITAPQELQEAHSTLQEEQKALQEKYTVLEAKAAQALQRAADAEGKATAEEEARRATEAELATSRDKGLGLRKEAIAAREEAVEARAALLAEKERVAAFTASHRQAERERGKMAAALQQLEKKHAASVECLTEETNRGDAARREHVETLSALEAALVASKLETVAARTEALAEKERAAAALTELKSDTSATLARVVRDNTMMETELAAKDKVEAAGVVRDLRSKIVELKGNLKEEKRTVHEANMAMEGITKTKEKLVVSLFLRGSTGD